MATVAIQKVQKYRKYGSILCTTGLFCLLWSGTAVRPNAQTVPKEEATVQSASIIDPEALELLDKVHKNLRSIHTLRAVCMETTRYLTRESPSSTAAFTKIHRIRLMQPNFCWIDTDLRSLKVDETVWHQAPFRTIASDGKQYWTLSHHPDTYTMGTTAPDGNDIPMYVAPLYSFFDPDDYFLKDATLLLQQGTLRSLTLSAPIHSKGKTNRLIRMVYRSLTGEALITEEITIGADLLIHRIHRTSSEGKSDYEIELSQVQIDKPMTRASFAYKLPAGARPASQNARTSPDFTASLLPIGTPAPDFTVQDAHGNPLRLTDNRGKWVILDFWATWCGPCLQAMPHLNRLVNQHKEQHKEGNLVVLAVSEGDTSQGLQAWLPKHTEYDALQFALDPAASNGRGVDVKLYHAGALPTTFVIDPEGIIRASFVGYGNENEARLDAAIKRLIP